ncbi:T9SS type A sorting domain-containing protein [Marixanthomonas ophiurae]|uniref:T9SS C-terminal target domain-containing protein n=1 Tax=Marixanthomonas ophiurae TaxID=387659 RepID=A0A3E1QBR0_9FLAO|nr:T9SS type A sorting domain-containing protein [Marixanthomonas ophiurae]RFN59558.1 T9SS C-terminal target domain-containing protein [Marixanthomonas ophiurae]
MKSTTTFLCFISILITAFNLYAQDPNIIWQRTIGGANEDKDPVLLKIQDGLLVGGTSQSDISGEKTENSRGGKDFWILKLNNTGDIIWQRTIGGSGDDNLTSLSKTNDGGYLIGGSSNSPISGEKTENSKGGSDYWIIKLDESGSILWQKTIGGTENDTSRTLKQTDDGGYIVYGSSYSGISGDRTVSNNGDPDLWILKLQPDLSISWQNSYNYIPTFSHHASNLEITDNGDYIFSSTLDSFGQISSYHITKINSSGTTLWNNIYGGERTELAPFISATNEGNFIVAGASDSSISGDKNENSQGSFDYWLLELDSNGAINWQNTIGGAFGEQPWDVITTQDGGYIVSGNSDSDISGDKTENSKGGSDYWIVKVNDVGVITWQNTIGGEFIDDYAQVMEGENGNIFVCGESNSNISADKTENSRGLKDFWILKLNTTLGLDENSLYSTITLYPNPAKNTLQLNADNQHIDRVKIFSVKGDLVQQVEGFETSKTIDVSQLASGMYYVQFTAGRQIATKKFIKQ